MINIGIDVHKIRCIATIKNDIKDNRKIFEQISFANNTEGITDFIRYVKDKYKDEPIRGRLRVYCKLLDMTARHA